MKFYNFVCLIIFLLIGGAESFGQEPPAKIFFDTDENKFKIAVKLFHKIDRNTPENEIKVSLWHDSRKVPNIKTQSTVYPQYDLEIVVSDQNIFNFLNKPFQVHVEYPSKDSSGNKYDDGFQTNSEFEINSSLITDDPRSDNGLITLLLKSKATDSRMADIKKRLESIKNYINANLTGINIVIDPLDSKSSIETSVKTASCYNDKEYTNLFVVLSAINSGPIGKFNIEVKFPANCPFPELSQSFIKKNLLNTGHKIPDPQKKAENNGIVPQEENLDLSLQFSSSVSDSTQGSTIKRERRNQYNLSLKIAPLLNIIHPPSSKSLTFMYFTPFYLDAKIANGPITKTTLALNRVYLGSQFEIRKYTKISTNASFHRFIFTALNSSDRDFKQSEALGMFEWQPIFSFFNNPLSYQISSRSQVVDRSADASPVFYNDSKFGYKIVPSVGVQLGKIYRNKYPFAKIEKTDFVRRFFFGISSAFDFTKFIKLSLSQRTFIRGESKDKRFRNYFNGIIEFQLPSFNSDSGQSFFLSYEKGTQPPFSSPYANSFSAGYRLQWSGWFNKIR